MRAEMVHLFVPLIGLIIDALCQVACFRWITRRQLLQSVAAGYAAGLLAVIVMEITLARRFAHGPDGLLLAMAFNAATYSALAFNYWALIGLGLSLRIRILDIVARSPGGIDHDALRRRFDPDGLTRRRIARLIGNGQLRCQGDRCFAVDSPFLKTARLNAKVKRFFTGRTSEFTQTVPSPLMDARHDAK